MSNDKKCRNEKYYVIVEHEIEQEKKMVNTYTFQELVKNR